jgi:hypothetical protein
LSRYREDHAQARAAQLDPVYDDREHAAVRRITSEILAALVCPGQGGWKDRRRQARFLEHRRDRPRLGQHRR